MGKNKRKGQPGIFLWAVGKDSCMNQYERTRDDIGLLSETALKSKHTRRMGCLTEHLPPKYVASYPVRCKGCAQREVFPDLILTFQLHF